MLFFKLRLFITFVARTYLLFTPGYCFFYLVTHTLTLQGFCADAHRFAPKCWWSVGSVGSGGINQPTHHPTHPANHLPTNLHPSIHTHPATMQGFCADVHRVTMEAIPEKIEEPPTQQLNAVKSLTNQASVTLLIPMTTSFSDRVA